MVLNLAALFALVTVEGRAQFLSDGHFELVVADYSAFLLVQPLDLGARDDDLVRLLKKRQNAAVAALMARHTEFLYERGTVEFLFDAARRLRKSRLELCASSMERVVVLTQYAQWTSVIERIQKSRMERGLVPVKHYQEAMAHRLEAEIEMIRINAKGKVR